MSIEIQDGVGNSSDNGGKTPSSSFPTTVTSSGSSLPATTGYSVGDTFLNTSDKKIYMASASGYELNSYFSSIQQKPNGSFNGTTGNFSNGGVFLGNDYNFSGGSLCVPIQTDADIQSTQGIVCSYSGSSGSQIFYVYINTGSIYIGSTKICDVLANHKYIVICPLAA